MRIISPVTVELTDAELVTIQRALERWSGMDDELAQLIGAVAETGTIFTLATMPDAETTAERPDPVAITDEFMANMAAKKTGAA
ncbi:hypothetical protein FAM23868_001970 [Propionibacterium freudenreichii]|uniref:hypothetical protein n=1 Tax=Propionibacterium freudenreichii TaxID=1744 RepID=UPI00254FAD27|nr:hypothetical protein [Propionibacterium freudenreichii]MDK9332630.1 hypothetical protein [Propionibacterium freudenreichii]